KIKYPHSRIQNERGEQISNEDTGGIVILQQLIDKLENRKATAAVIGLGYVGLPLAMEIAAAGFHVIGIDLDRDKIATLKQRKSYILDVLEKTITRAMENGSFKPTSDFTVLANADAFSIFVTTPFSIRRDTTF